MNARHLVARIIYVSALLAIALTPATSAVRAAQSPQVPLAGRSIPQFVDPLPVLDVAGGAIQTLDGTVPVTIRMCEFRANMLPASFTLPSGQAYHGTWVWGYLPDRTGNPDTTCDQLVAAASDGSGVIDTYTGPVILAQRRTPTEVTWINDLGSAATTNVLAYRYSTDQTLHWADPEHGGIAVCAMAEEEPPAYGSECAQNYSGSIPAVAHLHGGEVPAALDGGPDAWFTADGAYHGHAYYTRNAAQDAPNSAVYRYPNVQEAAPMWFHDHVLGVTRLNVYAGLAGAYLLADPALELPAGLAPYGLQRGPTMDASTPLVIQDRTFDRHGQLFFPADSAGGTLSTPNPDHPYWVPEFLGDTVAVNGRTWPYLNVEPKRYRFLMVNGSNARTYQLGLVDPVSGNPGPAMWVIATEGGYLDAPVRVGPSAGGGQSKLLMMPGERYDTIVDFAGFDGGRVGPNGRPYSGQWLLRNTARAPYPSGEPPQPTTTGRVMKFIVGNCTSGDCAASDTSYNPAAGIPLRPAMVRLADPATGRIAAGVHVDKTRVLTLNEVISMAQTAIDPVTGAATAYPGGPLEVLVNNTEFIGGETPRPYGDFVPMTVGEHTAYYSELPVEGQTEVWEIVNMTADAHPIHLHLVQFQLINRQRYHTRAYENAYAAAFPGGAYLPAFGPPQDYRAANNPLSGGKDGGNPDIDATRGNGSPLYLIGQASPPGAYEAGWKDTVMVPPRSVTRIAVRWAPTSLPATTSADDAWFAFTPDGGHGYVWHCHIIDHEDNEMMRPFSVQVNSSPNVTRSYLPGSDF